jgi:hypothetical protein
MPRSERPVDPAAGPVEAFAAELRKLRTEAGSPTYLKMHRASGRVRSKTALSEAAGGDHLPTWETVEAYVRALGADPAPWLPRWEQAHDAGRDRTPAPPEPTPEPPGPPEPPHPPRPWTHRRLVAATVTLVAAAIAVPTLARHGRPEPVDPGGPVAVVIQNKVAVGPTSLVEDSTPVYLSARPIPFCSRQGCELPRTSMWSGATVPVTCRLTGTWMTNENLMSPGITRNPGRASSTTWYRAVLSDGRTGYISVVYLESRYRQGLPLPHCPKAGA